jgi:hypothetical protein
MNAYILEINGRHAAALTEDGRFVRVKNKNYFVGQSVQLNERKEETKQRVRYSALASMAAGFALLLFGGFAGYNAPVGVVSLDVNPSIEYTINCFDRVLSIEGVNEDGSRIISEMNSENLINQPVSEAVEATILQLRESGYLMEQTDNDVVLSASALTLTHANALANRLEQLVMQQGDLQVTSVSVSKSEVQQAHALGTSAGKLYLIERLQQATGTDEAFDPKDWLNTPVREIIRETATRSGAPQPNGEQNGQTPAGSQSDATPPQSGTGATVPGGSTTSPQPTGGEQGGPVGPGPTDSSGGTGGAGGEPPAGGSPPG